MKRPLLFIFLTTLLISGTSWGAWALYRGWMKLQSEDPRYILKAILVKPLSEDTVPPGMIAEWLNLSRKKPVHLYSLSLKRSAELIEAQKPVKRAVVKRIPPSTLLVEIELRHPIALLGERTNTALDEEGVTFPLVPFYTPKKLPTLFLGEMPHFALAKAILEACQEPLSAIDVAKCDASSYGEREIVLNLNQTYVRLDPEHWQEGLTNLFKLKYSDAKIIDLRVPHLVLILPKEP